MIARDVHTCGFGAVVAAVDSSPQIAGRSLGDAVDGLRSEVVVAPAVEEVPNAERFDCAIVATSSDLRLCAPVFGSLLSRGLPVVSTCEELLYPWLRHPNLAESLHALAVRRGGRLLGTGVNPGFLMDTLPVCLTAACRSVERVRVWRVQDAGNRRKPFQAKIGATLDREQFAKRAEAGTVRHVGLAESLHFVADLLDIALEGWDETIEPVIAESDLDSALGPIPAGRVAGVRQVARGHRNGEDAIALEFIAAVGHQDPHDRILVEGDPRIDVMIPGGVHGDAATVAMTLNVIDPLLRSSPGLHTMATIPLAACRRSPPHRR